MQDGEALPIHPSLYYVCREVEAVAEEYHNVVPHFAQVVKRALNECAQLDNIEFAKQRCRFFIFEYFVRMTSRRLVADKLISFPEWQSNDDVTTFETNAVARWQAWFVNEGIHINSEAIGFRCEVRRHYIEIERQVYNPPN